MPKKLTNKSFTERVLEVVKNIPPGKTRSYAEVANLAGSSGAARAVGTIMSKNYREDIPCHRVIKSDGTPGAYNRGGEVAKRAILANELKSSIK